MSDFERVVLRSGESSIRERRSGEIMHPGLGPRREAELLYVEQTLLAARLADGKPGPVRVLDVGLGAGTNALAVLRCSQRVAGRRLDLTSLEHDEGPLRLALSEPEAFPWQAEYRGPLEALLEGGEIRLGRLRWRWPRGDALAQLATLGALQDIICFDPFSPEANPQLWTVNALARFRVALAPGGILSTYSASTRTRVTLLLAGFWVGAGRAAAAKTETTVASDGPDALEQPLGWRWLQRWRRSTARAPHGAELTADLEERIRAHPQFAGTAR
jgi:tRNA U34 5-methylaminomethyl-2-thiouridine-forming methyltransferase MnmC